ncbi:MAG: hypothetical protein JWQ35_2748 [Bacteriovoracaceae bacterium]|nr:hypothetical protein [Bacteriovoracaceae bacterium]
MWIGYHGIISYSAFCCGLTNKYVNVRFKTKGDQKPIDQLVEMLDRNSQRQFGIFTDAGGPYGKVKGSLVALAKRSGRPLIPLRSFSANHCLLLGHQIPYPKSPVTAVFGKAITPEELSFENPEENRKLLQTRLEDLKNPLK